LSFDRTGFISGIVSELEKTNAAVIGPAMKSSLNNAELNPIYKNRLTVPHIKRLLSVTGNYLVYLIYQKLHYIKRAISGKTGNDIAQLGDCYAIHGSFMIFKRQFFDANGTLNYGSFLYGEEIFVAEQCLRLGLKIAVTPNIEVIHHEHTTTGKMKDKRHMGYLNQSIQYLKKEYFLG
jgi:GT2 family glycosyltransferase